MSPHLSPWLEQDFFPRGVCCHMCWGQLVCELSGSLLPLPLPSIFPQENWDYRCALPHQTLGGLCVFELLSWYLFSKYFPLSRLPRSRINFFSSDIFIIAKEDNEHADFFVLLNNTCMYSVITLRRFLEECIAFILPISVVYLEINVRFIMMTVTC